MKKNLKEFALMQGKGLLMALVLLFMVPYVIIEPGIKLCEKGVNALLVVVSEFLDDCFGFEIE